MNGKAELEDFLFLKEYTHYCAYALKQLMF
jgi:hypothetical protein